MPGEEGTWIVSGGKGTNGGTVASVIQYNGTHWDAYNNLGPGISDHCQVNDGKNVLVIGGTWGLQPPSSLKNVFKLSGGVWFQYHLLKTPRMKHMCVVLNDIVYVMGGIDDTRYPYSVEYLSSVEMLLPGSDGWTPGPAMPDAVYQGQAVVYNNSIFVVGRNNSGMFAEPHMFRLDEGAYQWVTVEDFFSFGYRYVFPPPLLYEHQLYCK